MEPQKRIFGLRKNVFFLGLVSLFNDFSSEMVYSVMPAFLTTVLGAPAAVVGLIEGFADALSSILKIFSGWFSDKVGKRKIFAVIGYSLSVSTRIILTGVSNFWEVFGLRATDRMGKGFRDAPRDALITESVEPGELGKSFGYHRALDTIGATLGPLGAIWLLSRFGGNYKSVFTFAFFAGILAIITFLFVKDIPRDSTQPVRVAPKLFALNSFSKDFRWYVATVFLFGLGFLPVGLLLLDSPRIGFGLASMPLLYFVYSLSFVIFALPFGSLSDKIGERKVILLGFLAAIACYATLLIFNSPAGIVAAFIILGLYSAMTEGVQKALAGKIAGPDQRATGQGILNAAIGMSSLIAGVCGGLIWTSYGSNAGILYGIILMSIGLISFTIYTNIYGKDSN